jgi:hypothetical protein
VRQVKPFTDERLADYCAFCGDPPATRDHVPPKIFLDQPHPDNYPVVGCCLRCNNRSSLDEEYVACLLAVAMSGSADPAMVGRPKIARTLEARPPLARQLGSRFSDDGSFQVSQDDNDRIHSVFEKIARGLWSFENGETAGQGTADVRWAPMANMTSSQSQVFYQLSPVELLPEVGSRALMRVLADRGGIIANAWTELQPDRFSYVVEVLPAMSRIKMIVGNYIAVQVELVSDERLLIVVAFLVSEIKLIPMSRTPADRRTRLVLQQSLVIPDAAGVMRFACGGLTAASPA